MHIVANVGNRLSSRCTTLRLSDGALRFLGVAGFLKGSAPEAFAHLWHKRPRERLVTIVYLVYINDINVFPSKNVEYHAYHGKLILTLSAVFKTSDRRLRRWSLIRRQWLGQRIISIVFLVVVIIIIVILFLCLCLRFCAWFLLCCFGQLSLFGSSLFFRFIELVWCVPSSLRSVVNA
jgi:hypothetical protein